MTFKHISYEKRGKVAYITMNRPKVLNALHPPANAEMLKAFVDYRDDDSLLVAILTGSGTKAFSTGNDLKFHSEHIRHGEPYPDSARYPFGGITMGFTCWKPIVAAVNGYALGGGLELMLACDLVIAAESAMLGLPEVKSGVVATAGGTQRLPRQIPYKIALGMLLTGEPITAQEALRLGLVNDVVPDKDLLEVAHTWADRILKCAPLSVRATKQMATLGIDQPLQTTLNMRYSELNRALVSEDYQEGPRAFLEKRTPKWRGN
jgi:enoyl-CoA hydratase/carnithine racemase